MVKLLVISLKYAASAKEKVLSSAIRALGYIISRCSYQTLTAVFDKINSDEELRSETVSYITSRIDEKLITE